MKDTAEVRSCTEGQEMPLTLMNVDFFDCLCAKFIEICKFLQNNYNKHMQSSYVVK